jgi:hypothetical protein
MQRPIGLDSPQANCYISQMRMSLKYSTTFSFLVLLVSYSTVRAQGSSGTDAKIESRYLIDLPTAGMIGHESLALDVDFFQSGGMLTGVSIGVLNRLMFGLSYGGTGIIGTDKPVWNSTLGVHAKLRVVDESIAFPAIAVGFNSQGKEMYVDNLSRYTIKSPGFYAVGSKNYRTMGTLSFHGGINYSLEHGDNDEDINFFGGVEKSLGPFISLLGEYNLALNDGNGQALGRGRGYFNLGMRISIGNGLSIGFALKDLLKNQPNVSIGNRIIQLEYVTSQ